MYFNKNKYFLDQQRQKQSTNLKNIFLANNIEISTPENLEIKKQSLRQINSIDKEFSNQITSSIQEKTMQKLSFSNKDHKDDYELDIPFVENKSDSIIQEEKFMKIRSMNNLQKTMNTFNQSNIPLY